MGGACLAKFDTWMGHAHIPPNPPMQALALSHVTPSSPQVSPIGPSHDRRAIDLSSAPDALIQAASTAPVCAPAPLFASTGGPHGDLLERRLENASGGSVAGAWGF